MNKLLGISNAAIALAMALTLSSAAKAQDNGGKSVTQNGVKVEFSLPTNSVSGAQQGPGKTTDETAVTYSSSKKLKLTVSPRTPLDSWQLSQLKKAFPSRDAKYVTGLNAGALGQDELLALLVSNPQSGSVPARSSGAKWCSKPAMIVFVREVRTRVTSYQAAVTTLTQNVNVSPEFLKGAQSEGAKLSEITAALAPLLDDERILLTAIEGLNGKYDLVIDKLDQLIVAQQELKSLIVDGFNGVNQRLDRIDGRLSRIERGQTLWGIVGVIGDVANLLKRYTTTIKIIKDCGGGC